MNLNFKDAGGAVRQRRRALRLRTVALLLGNHFSVHAKHRQRLDGYWTFDRHIACRSNKIIFWRSETKRENKFLYVCKKLLQHENAEKNTLRTIGF